MFMGLLPVFLLASSRAVPLIVISHVYLLHWYINLDITHQTRLHPLHLFNFSAFFKHVKHTAPLTANIGVGNIN